MAPCHKEVLPTSPSFERTERRLEGQHLQLQPYKFCDTTTSEFSM